MASQSNRIFTLVQREMREYRSSLFWTPIVIAVALLVLASISVILANRISVLGNTLMDVVLKEETLSGMNIRIKVIDGGEGTSPIVIRQDADPLAAPSEPGAEPASDYRIIVEEEPVDESEWNFSREWTFTPRVMPEDKPGEDGHIHNMNPALNVIHLLLMAVLFIVSVNYLCSSLFSDRKDRSILFWKSMPVSEWEEVLAKLLVALVVAPMIYIAVSIVTQLATVLLSMLMVWRMDLSPTDVILGNVDLGRLFFGQISGWLLTMLLLLPTYAWLMLASAAARRSPFLLAVAPVVGLIVLERLFVGSNYASTAVMNHVPHIVHGSSSVGLYFTGPQWGAVNYLSVALGLLFAAVVLAVTVNLRRYRFEI